MPWTARLNTVTPDANNKVIIVDLTINGGMVPYSLVLRFGMDDISFSEGEVRTRIRTFIERVKKMEAAYNTLKPLEGQDLPLGV